MSEINKFLEELTVREQKTRIMTEDITAMNEKLKKLESELSLWKARHIKLEHEISCKKQVLQDKSNELTDSRNQLLIWQQLLKERTEASQSHQNHLESVQEAVCNIRENFCEAVNKFVDVNDIFIGERRQKLLSSIKTKDVIKRLESDISTLERDVKEKKGFIQSTKARYDLELENLQFEKERLELKANRLMDTLRQMNETENNVNQNFLEVSSAGCSSYAYTSSYSSQGTVLSHEGDFMQSEDNCVSDRFVNEDAYCGYDGRNTIVSLDSKFQSPGFLPCSQKVQKKRCPGFIPIAGSSKKHEKSYEYKQCKINQFFKQVQHF